MRSTSQMRAYQRGRTCAEYPPGSTRAFRRHTSMEAKAGEASTDRRRNPRSLSPGGGMDMPTRAVDTSLHESWTPHLHGRWPQVAPVPA
jgi:hypothetical protein